MSDIVEQLRAAFQRKRYGGGDDYDPDFDLFDVAADEIERLAAIKKDYEAEIRRLNAEAINAGAENERLQAALELIRNDVIARMVGSRT